MNGAKIIIGKELSRVFKDKKLVFSLFILPAIIMIGLYSLLGSIASNVDKDVQEHTPSMYFVNAPANLDEVIKENDFIANIDYASSNNELESRKAQVLSGELDLLVVFDDNFEEMINNYQKENDPIPSVNIFYNMTESYSSEAKNRFSGIVLSSYKTGLLAKRLGNLDILSVFNENTEIIADEVKQQGQFMSIMVPYLITFLLFTGAMSLGVDIIAGEKERGTLASMLLSPISRGQIVAGKIISIAILSSLSAIVYAASMIISLPMMMDGFGEATKVSFDLIQILELLAIMLVMVYLYVSIVTLIATFAKDTKTASSYIAPIYIVVIVAGILTMFTSGKTNSLLSYAIPVYGNALSIQNLILHELTIPQFLLTLVGTGATAFLITVGITKAFNSEKVMFNA